MSRIRIYTTRWCGYCVRAKTLLDGKSIPYDEIPLDDDPGFRRNLFDLTGGWTVPQIRDRRHADRRLHRALATRQVGRARRAARRLTSRLPSTDAALLSRTARTAAPFVAALIAVSALAAADGGYFPSDWGLATLGFALDRRHHRPRHGCALARAGWSSPSSPAWPHSRCGPRSRSCGRRVRRRRCSSRSAASSTSRLRQPRCCSCRPVRPRAGLLGGVVARCCARVALRARHQTLPGSCRRRVRPLERLSAGRADRVLERARAADGTRDPARAGLRWRTASTSPHGCSQASRSSSSCPRCTSRSAAVRSWRWPEARSLQAALDPRRARLLVSGFAVVVPAGLGVLEASRSHALTAAGATLQTAQAEGAHLTRVLVVLGLVARRGAGRLARRRTAPAAAPASRRNPRGRCRRGRGCRCGGRARRSGRAGHGGRTRRRRVHRAVAGWRGRPSAPTAQRLGERTRRLLACRLGDGPR